MLWIALALTGCANGGAPSTAPGTGAESIRVDVAALDLAGVGDVVWDIEVDNGGDEVVWQRRLTSSAYGDSAGSASFVGPCDADPAVSLNTVNVWVVGVYDGDIGVADLGAFASGASTGAGAVTGTALPFQNPTSVGTPLSRDVECSPNADTAVSFDVALLRPAQQGFFDVAVSFNDIFCSAKLDCCDDADANGCAANGSEDIHLLFDDDGARSPTFVLGLACTAGVGDGVDTALYLDPIALDCSSPNSGTDFSADITLDPSGGPGNLCTAGDLATCPAVLTGAGLVDTYLYQVAVFRGVEALTSGSDAANKVYWNVALGVDKAEIGDCRLRTKATADDDGDDDDGVVDGQIAASSIYPYVAWDVALDASCGSSPLGFGVAGPVSAAYSDGTNAENFAFGYGPTVPAGTFCNPACENGGTCVAGACDCPVGYGGSACETLLCPLEIPGCDSWADVADASTVSGSGSSWVVADKSGHGNTFNPLEGAPTYSPTGLNGLGAIIFDGVDDGALGATKGSVAAGGTYRTFALAFRINAIDLGDDTLASFNCSDGAPSRRNYWGWKPGRYVTYATGAQWDNTSFTFSDSTTYVIFFERDRATGRKRIYVDGTLRMDLAYTVSGDAFVPGRCHIGGDTNGWDNMTIGEMITYERILSPTERAQITSYLQAKWQ